MHRIALEEHFVMNQPEHIDRWRSLIPNVPTSMTDKILKPLIEVGDGRLEAMSKAGIDLALLSDAGIVQNVLDPTPALRLAKNPMTTWPKWFSRIRTISPVAAVPLVDPKAGADEFERAIKQLASGGQ